MDKRPLDPLRRMLVALSVRSDALRFLAGGAPVLAAEALGTRFVTAGARCVIRGKRCRHDRQCCSRDCWVGSCR